MGNSFITRPTKRKLFSSQSSILTNWCNAIEKRIQEEKQRLSEEDMGDNYIEILKELMPSLSKRLP